MGQWMAAVVAVYVPKSKGGAAHTIATRRMAHADLGAQMKRAVNAADFIGALHTRAQHAHLVLPGELITVITHHPVVLWLFQVLRRETRAPRLNLIKTFHESRSALSSLLIDFVRHCAYLTAGKDPVEYNFGDPGDNPLDDDPDDAPAEAPRERRVGHLMRQLGAMPDWGSFDTPLLTMGEPLLGWATQLYGELRVHASWTSGCQSLDDIFARNVSNIRRYTWLWRMLDLFFQFVRDPPRNRRYQWGIPMLFYPKLAEGELL